MTGAVFAQIPADQGHYESFFLRAVDPEQPRAAWIRYTVHKRPDAEPVGSLWCTLFDAEQVVVTERPGQHGDRAGEHAQRAEGTTRHPQCISHDPSLRSNAVRP
jgi:hypothetical protein